MNTLQREYTNAKSALVLANAILDSTLGMDSIQDDADLEIAEARHNEKAVEIGYDAMWDRVSSAENELLLWSKGIALDAARNGHERECLEVAYTSKRIAVRRQIIDLALKLEVK